ncbi:MAG: hypothetical protein FWD50_08865, partial [Betaproteobacteria bacterium]|nr:hypothetical protein [Betaproteobacteria bacterium]
QPVGSGGKDSIAQWGKQGAAAFSSAIKESIAETIDLVLMDMNLGTQGSKQKKTQEHAFSSGAQQVQIKGWLIKEGVDRKIVLGDDEKLYSLPMTSKAVAATNQ